MPPLAQPALLTPVLDLVCLTYPLDALDVAVNPLTVVISRQVEDLARAVAKLERVNIKVAHLRRSSGAMAESVSERALH